ncbi:TMEM165/GDT1 family protein [Egbenema bharatensis]|uniref:TMEM165/GDT1 family protein n=1 Tax=Egbenema bharatensis TaxID=3463334 RepID=UPI003A83ED46
MKPSSVTFPSPLPLAHDPADNPSPSPETVSQFNSPSEVLCVQAQLENPPAEDTPFQADATESVNLTGEVRIFLSTFVTIFLAELGDKTQVTTLLMSAESDSPWLVFAGAGMALVATSLLGVLMGHWLSKRVSPRTLEVATAVLLLVVSLMLVWDVVQA